MNYSHTLLILDIPKIPKSEVVHETDQFERSPIQHVSG